MHWPAATRVFSAKAPMPRAGESGVPSTSVIFWVALWVAKQYCGRPRRHERHSPHTARQLSTTKSPGATEVTSGPDGLHDAGRLVAEQERELVVDPALPVVEVGVADPAGLDPDDGLAGPGVRDHDGHHLDRLPLGHRHHSTDLCCHRALLSRCGRLRRGQCGIRLLPDPGGDHRIGCMAVQSKREPSPIPAEELEATLRPVRREPDAPPGRLRRRGRLRLGAAELLRGRVALRRTVRAGGRAG